MSVFKNIHTLQYHPNEGLKITGLWIAIDVEKFEI
jgi:hypothetical protein